jgi:hypothetical protein
MLSQIDIHLDFRRQADLLESTSDSGNTSAATHISYSELDDLSLH